MRRPLICLGLLAGILFASLSSCEKDDICPEGTSTTPLLILRFYDIADNEELKPVVGLFAYVLDDDDSNISISGLVQNNSDSLTIPLRTDQISTRFAIYKEHALDENGLPQGNPETLTVNYTPEDIYVSRACGFKTVFNGLLLNVAIDGDNWILNSEVVQTDVESQTQAHVEIFH
ncbi:MAG: hypothetical protein HKM99_04760 [Flavobacteriaceae bacterium]|nr:hypothetical protein [Flavobacteriaceae bacterium]